ncbi:MAG TPA: DUF3891 family protein [Planctomycetaceae bacterium]|nr:DUF3891 family protein [Planctomycetaceae bacterium]
MIVVNVESGWQIMYQSAHALLAGRLATELCQLPKAPFWPETLAAIVDHDDHKESFGKNLYLTDLGAPKDFTQVRFTARERFEEVQRRIEHGFRKHRWMGLLAARHAEELYRDQKVSKKLADLLLAERKRRTVLLQEMKSTEKALETAYAVLQWCDRTSLMLCQDEIPAMHRRIEIASLDDDQRYELWRREDETIAVDPWPFRADQFEVQSEVRTLSQLTFSSDRELERCLKNCAVTVRSWTFQKSGR